MWDRWWSTTDLFATTVRSLCIPVLLCMKCVKVTHCLIVTCVLCRYRWCIAVPARDSVIVVYVRQDPQSTDRADARALWWRTKQRFRGCFVCGLYYNEWNVLDKTYIIDIQEGAAYNLYAVCQVYARVGQIRNTGLFIIPWHISYKWYIWMLVRIVTWKLQMERETLFPPPISATCQISGR